MTPKEKAKELVDKMRDTYYITGDFCYDSTAKQCALIAVDELIEEAYFTDGYSDWQDYWEEVKQNLENL